MSDTSDLIADVDDIEEESGGGHADYAKEHETQFLRLKFGNSKTRPGFRKVKAALKACVLTDDEIRGRVLKWWDKQHGVL